LDRFHIQEVLHSRSFITGHIDTRTGDSIGGVHVGVDFRHAAFTRTRSVIPARPHISGALIGPFGLAKSSIRVHGLLNPMAEYPIACGDFVDVPFCRFVHWPPGDNDEFQVKWTDSLPTDS
jgi:hypothetical protein